jgi:pantoate--beta-alanine ligase
VQLFKQAKALRNYCLESKHEGKRIGFVPTMGALHKGHLSLLKRSIKENDITVCSVFVNPRQFNDKMDLQNYPRTFEADEALLNEVGCDVLFHPDEKEIYPDSSTMHFELDNLESVLEGAHRPGHFQGVAQVVYKLLDIVNPHKAYFGLKDYQQYLIIKKVAHLLQENIDIIGCETERDAQGLALSSRNLLLSDEGKKAALLFSRSLIDAKKMIATESIETIRSYVAGLFKKSSSCELEYFEIVNSDTLMKAEASSKNSLIACIAGYVEGVRLIDNLILIP